MYNLKYYILDIFFNNSNLNCNFMTIIAFIICLKQQLEIKNFV